MRLFLHTPDQKTISIDKPVLSLGSDPAADVYLPYSQLAPIHCRIVSDDSATWVINPDAHAVHVNGRRISSTALIRVGDELHFDTVAVKVCCQQVPTAEKSQSVKAVNFSERVLLRVLTGAESGKAYALVNSLCIGRSAISEIQVDDAALAERQILIQRQGNDVLIKNLSPVLEMQIDGWICDEAILKPGSQLNIEQHRFMLTSSYADLSIEAELAILEKPVRIAEPKQDTALPVQRRAIFSRPQWILLASALAIAGLLVLLLTYSP